MTPPKPGIYHNIDHSEYLNWDAVSNSKLSVIKRSPKHFSYQKMFPPSRTDAQLIGSAIHTKILQPQIFNDHFVYAPDINRRTKAGKLDWEHFQRENEGKQILSSKDGTKCDSCAAAALQNTDVAHLIDTSSAREISALWQDTDSLLTCKARADLINKHESALIDIKTTTDASERAFSFTIKKYGYHRQAAFYLKGFEQLGHRFKRFVFIAIEKTPPYLSAVYELDNKSIRMGLQEIDDLLELYQTCEQANIWPGYDPGIKEISLPLSAFDDAVDLLAMQIHEDA